MFITQKCYNYFKFEVNWTLNGVDMTSQTYKHFIWPHMTDLHCECSLVLGLHSQLFFARPPPKKLVVETGNKATGGTSRANWSPQTP